VSTARTRELRTVAERIAAALPPLAEEVVLVGSVSRGVADELSDIEMLVVAAEPSLSPTASSTRARPGARLAADEQAPGRPDADASGEARAAAERIEQALTEPDALRALQLMTELQAETAELAPSGPNVDRARRWLPQVLEALREASGPAPDR
jgi:hypothetical protein